MSTQIDDSNDKPERRTQAERRAATQDLILEATLKTLVERGYSGTSMLSIAKEAKVSKGAITHHFANKADLVASAMQYFYAEKVQEASKCEGMAKGLDFRERMQFRYDQSLQTLPLRLEFLTAMRTDTALRDAYLERISAQTNNEDFRDPLFPEFQSGRQSETSASLLSAVMLGLGLTDSINSKEDAARVFEFYVDLVESHLHTQRDEYN